MTGLFSNGQEGRRLFYKTDKEVELVREACLIVSKTLAHVAGLLKPGITGAALDKAAEEFICDHKGRPAFKGYPGNFQGGNDFPASLCISYNDIVVHGIPGKREFLETDVVSVDCGVELNGFYGDAAFTFALNGVQPDVMELLSVTYASLYRAIDQAIAGKRIGDISFAVQDYCEKQHKFSVVRELVGHGVGRSLHEEPDVPNYGKKGKGMVLKEGLVIAIEPMVNLGVKEVYQDSDGWTIHTKDRKPSAHYEHTICVRKNKAEILSDHSFVLDAIKNNSDLQKISPKS